MTDNEADRLKELIDDVAKYNMNTTHFDALSEALGAIRQPNIMFNMDAINRITELSKDWDAWSKNVSDLFNSSGMAQTLSIVDKEMNSIGNALTVMLDGYDTSAFKRLGEALYVVAKPYLKDSPEYTESSLVIEDVLETPTEEVNGDKVSSLTNMFAGYLSANYGQQFNPSSDRNKIIMMFLFIFLSQIGTNLLNTSIEKTIFPDKEEQMNLNAYSNYTKEQIDRALDLEERKVKLQENEQKKDSK